MAEPDGLGGGPSGAPGESGPDTPERPPPGPDDIRPTERHARQDPKDDISPFGPPPALPPAALPWDTGDSPAVLGDGFAIETRAETLELLTFGDRVHRGDEAHLRTGAVGEFVDTVAGEERGTVHDRLTERTAKASRTVAVHQQTTGPRAAVDLRGGLAGKRAERRGRHHPRRRHDRHVDRGSAHRGGDERRPGRRRGRRASRRRWTSG